MGLLRSLGAASGAWKVVLLAWGVRLAAAWPVGKAVRAWVHEFSSESLLSETFAAGLAPALWAEWFRASWQSSSVVLAVALGALVLGSAATWFLDGMIYDAVSDRGPARGSDSLVAGGRTYFRLVRLSLFALPAHLLAVGGVGVGGVWAVDAWTETWPQEAAPLFLRWAVVVVATAALAISVTAHSLAKAEAVSGDERRARVAYLRGWVGVYRGLGACGATWAVGALVIGLTLAAGTVDAHWPRTGAAALWFGFLFQQGQVLVRTWIGVAYAHRMTQVWDLHLR